MLLRHSGAMGKPDKLILAAALLTLAACASTPRPRTPAVPGVKVGQPYTVLGRTYYPRDDRTYDERGIASWYGPGFHAKLTANGETYDQDDQTAAHKTLPMPSWVEVTNLDNGRQLTVRVNDRGPFVDGRIIDLSRRSAQLLGVDGPGLARVRVRRVYPPESRAFTPPQPIPSAPAPQLPPAVLTPPPTAAARAIEPAVAPIPPSFFVQVAALADQGRAEWLAQYLSAYGQGRAQQAPNGLWRVRLGPYAQERDAQDALLEVQSAGYPAARIVRPGQGEQ